jgi:hypothetical protein
MTEFETKCYGMTTQAIDEQYIQSITAEMCGIEMVVMGIASDCQELLSMLPPSPLVDRIRKQLNILKYIESEMMDVKRSKI